jgi:hypothetical protein
MKHSSRWFLPFTALLFLLAAPSAWAQRELPERVRFVFNGEERKLEEIECLAGENLILAVGAIDATPDVIYAFDNEDTFVAWARAKTPYGAEVTEMYRKILEGRQQYYPYGDAEVCHGASGAGALAKLGAGSLHEHGNYSGGLRPLSAPHFGWVGFDNRGSSAISIGLSTLFDRTFYRGPTVWLFAIGVPNLGVFNFNDRASSAL